MARRLAFQEMAFWDSLAMLEREAQVSARADWLRWAVWSMVPADVFERTAAWADNVRGPVYCRVFAWNKAVQRTMQGLDPCPEESKVHPGACWEDLRQSILRNDWHGELARHDAAGCSLEHCKVSDRPRPEPFYLGTGS